MGKGAPRTFPKQDFKDTNSTPRTSAIVKILHKKFMFKQEEHNDNFITPAKGMWPQIEGSFAFCS